MKKYTLTLFLFVFMTGSSHTLSNHTDSHISAESAPEFLVPPAPQQAPAAPRLQLDDSLYSDDEYALIAAMPATQKPAWKRHYEYVGARILSALLAMHKYASESYSSLKRFIMQRIMRRQLENNRAQNKQKISIQAQN